MTGRVSLLTDAWFQLCLVTAAISGALTLFNAFEKNRPAPGGASQPIAAASPGPIPTAAAPSKPVESAMFAKDPPATLVTQKENATPPLTPKTPGQWIVDATGAGDSDSTTIQPVLTSARSGDLVLVRAGTYRETIELGTSQITLRGIARAGEKAVIEGFGQATITMNAGKAAVENLTIMQVGGGNFRAVDIRGTSSLTLRNCDIASTTDTAIVAEAERLRVENCTVTSTEAKAGIGLKKGTEGEMVNCEIFGNATVGIAVESGSRGLIDGCRLRANGAFGLAVSGRSRATVRASVVCQNPKVGMSASEAGTIDAEKCELFENGLAVDLDRGASATIRGSKIRDNEYAAHVFAEPTRLTLDDCDVRGQRTGGIQIDDGGSATITRCRLTANKGWSLLVTMDAKATPAKASALSLTDSDIAQNGTGLVVTTGNSARVVGNRFKGNSQHAVFEPDSDIEERDNSFQIAAPVAQQAPKPGNNAMLHPKPLATGSESGAETVENGPGSPLRKALLDCARAYFKEHAGLECKFSVLHLKATQTRALALLSPQSADGRTQLPPAGFLFDLADGDWIVAVALSSRSPTAQDPAVLAYSIRRMAFASPNSRPPEIFPEPPATSEGAVRLFIQSYLLAGDSNDLDWQLAYYDHAGGAQVDYYDEGKLSAEAIRRSMENYNRRWPERRVILDGEPRISSPIRGTFTVNFMVRFEDVNQTSGVRGKAAVTMTLADRGDWLAISSVSSKSVERQTFTPPATTTSKVRSSQASPNKGSTGRSGPDAGKEISRAFKRSIHIGNKTLEDIFPTK